MRRTLIVGATSAIAQETAKLLGQAGDHLFLVARNPEKLESVSEALRGTGASLAGGEILDVRDSGRHELTIENAYQTLGGVDLAIIAHGDLPDQKKCEESYSHCLEAFKTNALSVFSLLILLSRRFQDTGKGTLVVISSVAGERGRRSNYVYGSAKGAVSLFTQGLRSQLQPHGIRVITVKPGLVDTPMTAHLKKGFLWASPSQVAKGIMKAIKGSKEVVYLPWFWRWIMAAVRLIPEGLFKRLNF